MKIYKLLFFLFAFIGFHSCAEYVGNGEDNGGDSDDTPNNPVFVARLVNNGAERVGETFEFTALLNGVNVTETTTFRVNGTEIEGHTYIPFRADEHSVIATKDDYTASFKFNVLAQDEESGVNRIEYDGQSYPVTHTKWVLSTITDPITQETKPSIVETDEYEPGGEKYTVWNFQSMDHESFPMSDNGLMIMVYVPLDQNEEPQAPHEAQTLYYRNSPTLRVNGSLKPLATFYPLDNGYPAVNFVSKSTSSVNYTIEIKKGNEQAKLFWNGSYTTVQP